MKPTGWQERARRRPRAAVRGVTSALEIGVSRLPRRNLSKPPARLARTDQLRRNGEDLPSLYPRPHALGAPTRAALGKKVRDHREGRIFDCARLARGALFRNLRDLRARRRRILPLPPPAPHRKASKAPEDAIFNGLWTSSGSGGDHPRSCSENGLLPWRPGRRPPRRRRKALRTARWHL